MQEYSKKVMPIRAIYCVYLLISDGGINNGGAQSTSHFSLPPKTSRLNKP